ncbi:uncharacterized protein LOC129589595 [Paramacrobiotus metropolitanus]|uniref:uncharacterized protein LOC129589595 n=1 Tax=Paramacrobiotus metropolitanus TaxID=2943436 RepID=UPI0024458C9B|nr:uncharacterized protein LOC129589595 [Paramacrobiotus metropolitanus]
MGRLSLLFGLLVSVGICTGNPMRQKRSWDSIWANFFDSADALTKIAPDASKLVAPLKANANETLVDITCKYSVHNVRECIVPVACSGSQVSNCTETVSGKTTKTDGIVKYFQECIFTQWFATCTHYKNGSYACRMAWQGPEDRRSKWGLYAGDVYTGFYAVDPKTGLRAIPLPGGRQQPNRPQAPPTDEGKQRQRREFEMHGTC